MLGRLSILGTAALAVLAGAAPAPSPTPLPDAQAEALFAKAKDAWRARTDVPYVRYGALVRYLHDGHVFDNWWDVYYRTDDGALSMQQLHDADVENRRLKGVPFSIFGLKIFDTNPDAAPIRLDDPRIEPDFDGGLLLRQRTAHRATPGPTIRPFAIPSAVPSEEPPSPASTALREITRVEANARDYQVTLAGTEQIADAPALHLHLVPLRDPGTYRLRDVWLDPQTYRTVQMNVQGLLNGKPYDGVPWTIHYVVVDGRQYVQQIVADQPLHFGIDTVVPKFEFDFVDYHFPADVPQFTFDHIF